MLLRGVWDGVLALADGAELPLVLRLEANSCVLDSPEQGAFGLPAELHTAEDSVLISIPAIDAHFEGQLSGDHEHLAGAFRQGGLSMSARFRRTAREGAPASDRPQMPKEPFPYLTEPVRFVSGEIALSATLTRPFGDGPFPLVVLVAGSGPQNRDEEVFGHRPFLVLADDLTKNGIATLRYDKRGVGESEGDYALMTQADLVDDASAAMSWALAQPWVANGRVGMLGHSEGGVVAAKVACSLDEVRFLVLLSTPARNGAEIIMSQEREVGLTLGLSPDVLEQQLQQRRAVLDAVRKAPNLSAARSDAIDVLLCIGLPRAEAEDQIGRLLSPWFFDFVRDEPLETFRRLTCPTLAIAGGLDTQVPADEHITSIRQALSAVPKSKAILLPDLNHLLQPARDGSPAEYAEIATTIDPKVLRLVSDWIRSP